MGLLWMNVTALSMGKVLVAKSCGWHFHNFEKQNVIQNVLAALNS